MSAFITFEGIEGAGKSSQLLLLEQSLTDLGCSCYLTAEPTAAYNKWRQDAAGEVDLVEQCLHLVLDRRRHLLSMKEEGAFDRDVILCDRFTESTLVYQGVAGIHPTTIDTINRLALTGFFTPDLTLWLDVPIGIALERIMARGAKPYSWNDRTGQDAEEVLRELRNHHHAYQMVARRYPERIVRIDASESPETVQEEILSHVKPFIERIFTQVAK